ncbi:MAG: CinA family nicotinamide mononucleotide deamidase-related protein [Elusimicrobiota bacterium]
MIQAPRIELICVGTELLSGKVNTHQSYISLALLRSGLRLARESSIPDDPQALETEIAAALERCDALIICGGLGPTFDDVTRASAAAAIGRPLIYQPPIYADIRKKLRRYRFKIPAENKRQAYVIQGAEILSNHFGSAPGQMISIKNSGRPFLKTMALLPGPFSELSPMFERFVLPELKIRYASGIYATSLCVHLSGIAESSADARLKSLTHRPKPFQNFTILAGQGQVDFYASIRGGNQAKILKDMGALKRGIYRAVGENIFGENGMTLEDTVKNLLTLKKMTLAAAESCTGGMLSTRLTAAPGSSACFKGGIVAYANTLKTELLGVRTKTIQTHGAVSAACAREMAAGVCRVAGASMGISITGIAGPSGASPQKPVGLVYIGFAEPGKKTIRVKKFRFAGNRQNIRLRATAAALHLLWEILRQTR